MFDLTKMEAASLYLAIQMILLMILTWRIIQVRKSDSINLGDGDNLNMQRRIRIHGNLIEYAPLFFLGLFALAATSASVLIIHGFGIVFTLARCGHAFNFHNESGKLPQGRFYGTVFTILSIFSLALTLLYFVLFG